MFLEFHGKHHPHLSHLREELTADDAFSHALALPGPGSYDTTSKDRYRTAGTNS